MDKVSFELNRGDYLSIVGPSGSGKSTLLHILGGLDKPSQGQVNFKGQNIHSLRDKNLSWWRNKHIGFVFQFYHLIEELNVLENIILPLKIGIRKSPFKRAQELLQYLGIEKRAKFYPSQLSGGEKQKVAIARAVVNDPEVILCDEPTGNLDGQSQERVVSLLEQLNQQQQKTIILVTHNLDLAKRAKSSFQIKSGRIDN